MAARQNAPPGVISKFAYDTLSDNIYLDCIITNAAPGASPAPLSITQTLPSEILKNPEKYYLSVIRWQLDGGASLPLMIFPDGTYYVVLGFNGTYASQVLLFPGYDGPAPPLFPKNGLYSYETFVGAVNTALATCFATLGGSVVLPVGSAPPTMYYNPDNSKFDIFYDSNYLESVALASRIQFFMNQQLFQLFNNYQAVLQKPAPFPQADYLLRCYVQGLGMNQPPLANIPAGTTRMTQEWAAPGRISNYDGVSAIRLKSSTLGVRFEYVINADTSLQAPSAGNSLPSTNLISDYIVGGSQDVGNAANYRQQLIYLPSAAYKLTDLLTGNMTSFDISVVWTDPDGTEYPYVLLPGSTATMKIALLHRSLYKNFSETVGYPPLLGSGK
jgi:hypothetical protein